MPKKKVTVIGGGNGSAMSLNALKQFGDELEISAVVSMSDSGGSSGRLREEFGTLPPGDIMRAVLAMSPHDYPTLKKIFHINRFSVPGKLNEHNLGNLFLVLSEKYAKDYLMVVRALEEAVDSLGHAYPVTLDKTDLVVELDNGEVIEGEDNIDRPNSDTKVRIKKAWLKPAGMILGEAKRVLEEADFILLGPGSFYTSIIATLLPTGVQVAIDNSLAKLIYVFGGAREIGGEAGPVKASHFYSQLETYLPRPLDYILRNNHVCNETELTHYKARGWQIVEFDQDSLGDYNIVEADYERRGGGLCPEKLGKALKKIIGS